MLAYANLKVYSILPQPLALSLRSWSPTKNLKHSYQSFEKLLVSRPSNEFGFYLAYLEMYTTSTLVLGQSPGCKSRTLQVISSFLWQPWLGVNMSSAYLLYFLLNWVLQIFSKYFIHVKPNDIPEWIILRTETHLLKPTTIARLTEACVIASAGQAKWTGSGFTVLCQSSSHSSFYISDISYQPFLRSNRYSLKPCYWIFKGR